MRRVGGVVASLLLLPAWAQATNACDLNNDGSVNVVDIQLAVNMTLGLASCTSTVLGAGVCNSDLVQMVKNAVLARTYHSVTLNWTASTSSNVAGYNVYRKLGSGGTYTQINSLLVPGVTYTDCTVQAGQTYYYAATAVDNNHNESSQSTPAQALIPSP